VATPRIQSMAAFVVPSTAAFGTASPSGPDWLHEVKFDGRRVQLQKDGDQVSIYGGNGADLTSRYPQISTAICALPCRSAILDAELRGM
jgi:bifunctional non-homologous end joining protein LigD